MGVNHIPLYTGIILVLVASFFGLVIWVTNVKHAPDNYLLTGLLISALGSMFHLSAGPFDFWWHETFGFDPFLFTPPHSLLIIGILLSGLGVTIRSVRLLHGYRSDLYLGKFISSRLIHLLAILSFATL